MKLIPTAVALILSASSAFAGGLTDGQHRAALAALDDEYMAWTVYEVVMEKFGKVKPFSNIQRAEAKHIAAVSGILKAEGYDVPANPYLNGDKPRPVAPANLTEACAIGVETEIANAALYDDDLLPAVAGHGELTQVMTALRDASQERHLPAFRRCAK
jgi:hypothetical protein